MSAVLQEAVSRLPLVFLVNLVAGAAGWRAGVVTLPGAAAGAVIGTAVCLGAGWAGWAMLVAAFLVAIAATRLGYHRKAALGIAEARGGRRGSGNAIANTGVAAAAGLWALNPHYRDLADMAIVASLATSASDTVASEVGKVWGRTTRLLITLRRVPPGTTGAVSMEGTVAGVIAAATLAGAGVALGLVPDGAIAAITVAATAASCLESVFGATLERIGRLGPDAGNNALNLVNSLLGAAFALAWFAL